jgi:hypothetical protein
LSKVANAGSTKVCNAVVSAEVKKYELAVLMLGKPNRMMPPARAGSIKKGVMWPESEGRNHLYL